MRLLLLHTDENILAFMPDLIGRWLASSRGKETNNVESEDGSSLDYPRLLTLLKSEFDSIIVNLRLPAMLSIRLPELARLARVPTRIILMSGAPEDLGPAVRLYDDYIRTPFYEKSLSAILAESLGTPFEPQRRSLLSQEHLDIAILNLLHRYDSLAPGCRGALHAFGLYRDKYLHRPLGAWAGSIPFQEASLRERLDFFASVSPLGFAKRVGRVMDRLEHSPRLAPEQKSFLTAQFNLLLDAAGLTLMNFRSEMAQILKGLEELGHMIESGTAWADRNFCQIRELLLAQSTAMPYVCQGVAGITGILPRTS